MESQKEQALHPLLLPLCVLVCGGAMIGVFRLLGKLDDSVLYGAALGCGVCILNLFLLRFTMNRAAAATSPRPPSRSPRPAYHPGCCSSVWHSILASPCQSSIPSPW